jgi:prophage tail gpP-like protein
MYKAIVRTAPSGGGAFQNLVWRNIKVRKSLDEICHYMELELPVSERAKIHKHDKVEVRLFSPYITLNEESNHTRRVTTVMVDAVTDVTDTAHKGLLVIGRSPARDIIDSTWPGEELHLQTLEQIANDIVSPFFDAVGIEKFDFEKRPHVTRMPTNGPETDTIFSFSWENESPWQKLIAAADSKGYIFTSNEAGNLYLWRVAEKERNEGFSLTEGSNIRNIQATENGAEQFHEYVVKGSFLKAREVDETCTNNRIMTIHVTDERTDQISLERRALTEKNRRKETRTVVTVSGWGLSENRIKAWGSTLQKEIVWNPNFLIPVTIPSGGLNGNLLISQVEYQADASSMTTALTLVNKKAYQ